MYDEDNLPDKKWFLYHADHDVTAMVVQIMEDKEAELSPKWKEEFEIETVYGDNAYLKDTISTTNYLMLRKIRKMIMENQQELERATDFEAQINCMKMHQHLKQLENELTNGLGTVIFR